MTVVHYLGMSPCIGLVLLLYWIQLSYTDVEPGPGASTWRTNTLSCDRFLLVCGQKLKYWRGTAELTHRSFFKEFTCFVALKRTFCSNGIPRDLKVSLPEEWKMNEFWISMLMKHEVKLHAFNILYRNVSTNICGKKSTINRAKM